MQEECRKDTGFSTLRDYQGRGSGGRHRRGCATPHACGCAGQPSSDQPPRWGAAMPPLPVAHAPDRALLVAQLQARRGCCDKSGLHSKHCCPPHLAALAQWEVHASLQHAPHIPAGHKERCKDGWRVQGRATAARAGWKETTERGSGQSVANRAAQNSACHAGGAERSGWFCIRPSWMCTGFRHLKPHTQTSDNQREGRGSRSVLRDFQQKKTKKNALRVEKQKFWAQSPREGGLPACPDKQEDTLLQARRGVR